MTFVCSHCKETVPVWEERKDEFGITVYDYNVECVTPSKHFCRKSDCLDQANLIKKIEGLVP